MIDTPRLERIENKLDEMSKVIVSLARMEERMVTLFKRMDHYDDEQRFLQEQLRVLSTDSSSRGQALRFAERVWWILLTAAIGASFIYLRG
jgi:hypothetical protein